jgi:isocitrate dehydrogenase
MSDAQRITVAYGDGIGPEIMEATLLILKEAGAQLVIDTIEIGEKLYAQSADYNSSRWWL